MARFTMLVRAAVMRGIALLCLWVALGGGVAAAAVWQWSVPLEPGRAFLWIPPYCPHVRAIVLAQNNMIEPGILEHRTFRAELSRLCLAEVFITPPSETWQNAASNDAANLWLDGVLKALADRSGYGELMKAPIVPLGHSAMASFPWNFAAWNPKRTLAILSVQGDAPLTHLTGNGRPNAEWGQRNIDGIPGVMAMAEYEWLEGRLEPALAFRGAYPKAPIALLAEPGSGHFNYPDRLVEFLALFLRKAVAYRLPAQAGAALRFVDPERGWLVERWYPDQPRRTRAAPFSRYSGNKTQAFWAFDEQTAHAIEAFGADQAGKRPQLVGYVDHGQIVPQTETHQQVELPFHPGGDGVTFSLSTTFLDTVPPVAKNLSRWTHLPAGAAIGHGSGPILVSPIAGPVVQLAPDTFRVQLDRIASTGDRRAWSIWLLANHPGDAQYKSAVQQALLPLPEYKDGAEQLIDFPAISDQTLGTRQIALQANSSSGRKVYFYVLDGPGEIEGDQLILKEIPRHAKLPISVTVVAWQLGSVNEPKLKSAAPVTRTFWVRPRK